MKGSVQRQARLHAKYHAFNHQTDGQVVADGLTI